MESILSKIAQHIPDTDLYQNTAVSIYDRFPSPDFTQVLLLIEKMKPGKGSAFDVGCGTGTLLRYLSDREWEVFGCDPSGPMVELARSKNPAAHIDVATATSFEAPRGLDLITSTFDVMNHLPTLNDVREFFERSSGALADDGVLIFDTVTPNDIIRNWPRYAHIESRTDELVAIRGEKIDGRTGRLHYDFFLKQSDGSYKRSIEVHTIRALPLAWTLKALRRSGFGEVLRFDAMNLEEPNRRTVRWIYAARKCAWYPSGEHRGDVQAAMRIAA